MRYLLRLAGLSFVIAFVTACVTTAPGTSRGKVLDYGIVAPHPRGKTVATPQTPSGVTQLPELPPRITTTTDRIPAKLGVQFGIAYEITGLAAKDDEEVEVELSVSFPDMTKPDGSVTKGFNYTAKSPVAGGVLCGVSFYSFDHEYELAVGTWRFEVRQAGKTMASKAFTVHTP
jgi:hypothetical protein